MCKRFRLKRHLTTLDTQDARDLLAAMRRYDDDEQRLVSGGLSDSTPSAVELPPIPARGSKQLEEYFSETRTAALTDLMQSQPNRIQTWIVSLYETRLFDA